MTEKLKNNAEVDRSLCMAGVVGEIVADRIGVALAERYELDGMLVLPRDGAWKALIAREVSSQLRQARAVIPARK
ncbi:MAG: hypothetical protein RJQ08_11345 [Salinisphaeraceae bacterium]